LAARISRADGGSFLFVGYRGVGKTSLANAVVRAVASRLEAGQDGHEPAILIDLSFAITRPIPPANLLYQMINGIRLELVRRGLFAHLPLNLRQELDLAGLRTAANLTRKGEDQKSSDIGLTIGSLPYMTKIKLGSTQSSRQMFESVLLPYEQSSAEQDLIRVARALSDNDSIRYGWLQKTWSRLRSKRRPQRLRLMFIFDELDKLDQTSDQTAISSFNDTLRDLKSLLTTSGVTFLFVAGQEIHRSWEEDTEKGDSIYESIFSHLEYVPLISNIGELLCAQLLHSRPEFGEDPRALQDFKDYLAYSGRGIPRRTLRAFQHLVHIDSTGRASLIFSDLDLRRFRCLAQLEKCLKDAELALLALRGGRREPDRADNDRLALRHLADWVIERGQTLFGMAEITDACARLDRVIAPRRDMIGLVARELVRALVNEGFLETASKAAASLDVIIDDAALIEKWRMPRRRLIELGRDLEASASEYGSGERIGSKYLITRTIRRGATGTIYEATDTFTDRTVAVKCFLPGFSDDDEVTARLNRNEMTIMSHLNHPAIPMLLNSALNGHQRYLVMEIAPGVPFDSLLSNAKRLKWEIAVELTREVLNVLSYVHKQGIIWGDLKPSNIMVEKDGEVRLLDFGAARFAKAEKNEIPIIGTRKFMAPECLAGSRPSVSSDIYAAGVLLFQATTGIFPFVGDEIRELLDEHQHARPIPPGSVVEMPEELERTILRCLAYEPGARFTTADELLAALPEGAPEQARADIHRMVLAAPIAEGRASPATVGPSPYDEAAGSVESDDFATPPGDTGADWIRDADDGALVAVFSKSSPIQHTHNLILDIIEPGRRQYLLLKSASAQMGRSPDNDIVISDPIVSRYCGRFDCRDGAWFVSALNSRNSMLVDGNTILGECQITDGTIIQIGMTRIRIGGPKNRQQPPDP